MGIAKKIASLFKSGDNNEHCGNVGGIFIPLDFDKSSRYMIAKNHLGHIEMHSLEGKSVIDSKLERKVRADLNSSC